MKRKKLLPIQSQEALSQIGQNIKEARLKRRMSIGAYALVIFVLGLTDKLKNLFDPFQDKEGINLDRQRYPKRIRYKKNEGCLF